jgi:hypothetical protein
MTRTTHPEWVDTLIDLLEQEKVIYEQLGRLGHEQSSVVDRGDTESLLILLGQRQTMIDQLVEINGQLEPYKQRWPELWAELDPSTQQEIRQLMDQVQGLLDGILEQDERDRAALTDRRQQVADELGKINKGTALNRAYAGAAGPASTPDPRYTDRTG